MSDMVATRNQFSVPYAAAGILPISGDLVLLGSEPVVRGGKRQVWWGAFGGRKEKQDDNSARKTAWREFHEETGRAFCTSFTQHSPLHESFDSANFESRYALECYSVRARYVLFFLRVPYLKVLPKFTDIDASRDKTLNKRELKWVPLRSLLDSVKTARSKQTLWSDQTELPGVGKIAPFIFHMLRTNCARIEQNLLLRVRDCRTTNDRLRQPDENKKRKRCRLDSEEVIKSVSVTVCRRRRRDYFPSSPQRFSVTPVIAEARVGDTLR